MSEQRDRLQRKLEGLDGQMNLIQSALDQLRRETANVASAAWEAIDAEAGVVAEEPEWETERQRHWCNPGCPDGCERWDEVSERRVTPWVPVKQEGEKR